MLGQTSIHEEACESLSECDIIGNKSGVANITSTLYYLNQGQVVRKPVNANPGLKVNRSIKFSCIKMFFASCFLFSLRLFKFKREGQTI